MKVDGWWFAIGVVVIAAGAIVWVASTGGGGGSNQAHIAAGGEVRDLYRAPVPDRDQACRYTSGTVAERVDACLAELAPVPLSEQAQAEIRDLKGKVLSVGDQLAMQVSQESFATSGEIRALLLGTDEEAAAAKLRDADFRGVVIHRDLDGAIDRDNTVLSRLARHDHLEWFKLQHVTAEAFIYEIRRSNVEISMSVGERMLAGLRARLEGRRPDPIDWNPGALRMIGSIRLQGATLAARHTHWVRTEERGTDFALDELASKLVRDWMKQVETQGHGRLPDRMKDARLELHLVTERASVEPRSRWQVYDLWEVGVDGVMFKQREGVEPQKFTYMPGSEAVTHSMKSGDEFLRYAVSEFGWNDSRPWEKDARTVLELIRTQHFMEAHPGGGRAVRMARGLPVETMDDLSDRNIRQMLVDGGDWWMNNMRRDGSFNYKYWPTQNRFSDDYNEVRHILATRDLADTWRYRSDPKYLFGSRFAMRWLMQYAVQDVDPPVGPLAHPPEGTMLFRYPSDAEGVPADLWGAWSAVQAGKKSKVPEEVRALVTGRKPPNQKLGTVAVALLGWVAYAEATGDKSQDGRIRKMARYVLSQLESNGKFQAYNVPQGHPYYGNKNDIVPGEAALALGEVAEYFGETDWVEFFPKFLDYYEPWFRSRAVKTQQYGRWPHDTYDNATRLDLVQFGPWAVMANKQYYVLTGDERAAAFGLEIADWMIDNYQWSGERAPFPEFVGGYYKMPTELPAMQSFCYSEGTAAAYHIASKYAPDRKDKYDTSTREALRFLRVMQYDDVDAYFTPRPELVKGGIKYAMNENKIRIDYVGHGLSTVSQYLDARDFDPAVILDFGEDPEATPEEPEEVDDDTRLQQLPEAPPSEGGEADDDGADG